MQPETLNRVEKRTVFGQPDDHQSVFVQAQGSPNGLAMVVRSVIHHQNQVLTRIFRQQMFQESDERIAILVGSRDVVDTARVPVISAEDMQGLWAAGRRNELSFPASHPTATQRRMQTYRCFVHKDEFGGGDGVERDVFFNQSITSAIVS